MAEDEKKISLSPEMLPFEWKLNTVKQNLQQQKEATALAEQRKDELVMYLAHDIRTPLTSVIGYLSLLEEEPDMTTEEKEKNVHIALDKAYRLEKMVNEFFEITRYHSKQIKLEKQPVDLYYMLMQLRDEFLPSFSLHNNTVSLDLDENTSGLSMCGYCPCGGTEKRLICALSGIFLRGNIGIWKALQKPLTAKEIAENRPLSLQ